MLYENNANLITNLMFDGLLVIIVRLPSPQLSLAECDCCVTRGSRLPLAAQDGSKGCEPIVVSVISILVVGSC